MKNTDKNNRLIEEEFTREKGPKRNFAEDAKRIAKNKRSQKGLLKFFKKKTSILFCL